MEQPFFAAHDRDPGLFPPPPGPVLYVLPLRIVAPPGVLPFLPPSFNPHNPFNGFQPGDLRRGVDADRYVKAGGPKTSAFREYPSGCRRNDGTKDPEPGTADAQHGLAAPREFDASQPGPGQSSEGNAAPPTSASRNRKRSVKAASESDTNRPRRPVGRRAPGSQSPSNNVLSPRKAVTDTVRLYDALRRNWVVEEELKGNEAMKGGRPDLNAGSIINSKGLAVNRGAKVVGNFPGVEVGDLFYFRMELCCIGLHGPIQAGIEYLTSKESEWNIPVAISIISAGGYDARDDGEVLIYTGQGGKSAQVSKPNEDQKLERGNLAMEGSMKHETPVRVIRGIKDATSPSGKTYTYDGLYKIEQCWSEKGKFGFEEFKFKLRRLPGQPELGSALINLSHHLKYKPATRKGVCLEDLSAGRESLPVCVVNTVDDQHGPAPFEYSTSLLYPTDATQQFGPAEGCNCDGACQASQSCCCFSRNNYSFAYLNNGVLVKERELIYECGSNCKCLPTCRNRCSQRSRKHRLEVFKTQDKGWGLRSWDIIPAGSFVCEYTGRVLQNLHSLQSRDYVLDLSRSSKETALWGDVSRIVESQASQASQHIARPDLIIDSSEIGNVARFINHSCSPNLLVQCVMRDHQEKRYPHVVLFAMDNIPPFRELTMDYGSEIRTSDLQLQSKLCLCRSADCRGRFRVL